MVSGIDAQRHHQIHDLHEGHDAVHTSWAARHAYYYGLFPVLVRIDVYQNTLCTSNVNN